MEIWHINIKTNEHQSVTIISCVPREKYSVLSYTVLEKKNESILSCNVDPTIVLCGILPFLDIILKQNDSKCTHTYIQMFYLMQIAPDYQTNPPVVDKKRTDWNIDALRQ